MTNVEIVKNIKGFEGRYTISNLGIVRSLLTNKVMKLSITSKGYARVNLRYAHSRKFKAFLVHRLVAGNFIPNPNHYKELNHKDCNRLNNNVSNLEWCDRSYNVKYSYSKGKASNKGEKNPNAKLNSKDVMIIKAMLKSRKYSQTYIAKLFKVHPNTIGMINTKNTWSDN